MKPSCVPKAMEKYERTTGAQQTISAIGKSTNLVLPGSFTYK